MEGQKGRRRSEGGREGRREERGWQWLKGKKMKIAVKIEKFIRNKKQESESVMRIE